jgi:ADP-heptose:LPS heptosyltransferase
LFRTIALIHRLRRRNYDIAIEMRGDDIGRVLAFCSGAPLRVGPDRVFYEAPGVTNLSFLQTHTVPLPDLQATPIHTVATDLALLQTLGLAGEAPAFHFPIRPERKAAVERKLQSLGVRRPFAVLHMRSNDAGRDWSVEGFAAVADHLTQTHGTDVVLTGARGDSDCNLQVLARCVGQTPVFNAAGVFKLQELPALFAQARLMVTVDTGPMHIAAAVGTPIVAIFLPQLAGIHHPYGQSDGVVVPASEELAALDWGELKSLKARSDLALAETVATTDVITAIERKLHGKSGAVPAM